MNPAIGILLEIQDKDQRLCGLRRVIAAAPADEATLKRELETAQARAEQAKMAVFDLEKQVKSIELDIQQAREKIRNLQAKSAQIKKNDDYKTAMHEISGHEAAIRTLEDREIALWEQIETAKQARLAVDQEVKLAKTRHDSAMGDLAQRARNCRDEMGRVEAERGDLAKRVPEDLLRLYERLMAKGLAQNQFRAMVTTLENENCGACHLKVPPMTKTLVLRSGHTTCSQCGAILYLDR